MPWTQERSAGSVSDMAQVASAPVAPAYVTTESALPSWLSSARTTIAPGPPREPPGVPVEGAATKRSPFGAKRITRVSITGVVVNSRTQKPSGTVRSGESVPGSSQNFGPLVGVVVSPPGGP